ncbi:MAG: UDP-N-acetylglucosamine--N-acetylmuramyl-(pentapeptide) pyrophosphoryl-undecaprenol N-acetylglucosamine transferase [Verrucomicrobia bacterium]|nr:UDP-N-acetylglucosamine--N-acetylmuramyl-(pentapeptide) pyrophosphoryl-undecaprenol N-acetylglucosamine transferase [Verrucomicrobiota bacterium]
MSKFLISCGGTGGHLSPGISLAEGLVSRGHTVTLLISQKKVDARLIEKYPHFTFLRIPGTGFSWNPVGLVRCILSQAKGLWFCLGLTRRLQPDGIVVFGGFTSAGVALAGGLRGIPVAVHESNRVPGLAIRILGRFARRVYLPPGIRLPGVRAAATRFMGMPVRREITRLPVESARAALGLAANQKVLVIFGGSQGSGPLNDWARNNLATFAAEGVQVYCVTGLGKGAGETLELKTKAGAPVRAVFTPFCDQVAELLSAADLVVSRAGAGTIAELIRCATPAILVPYPQAADNHQAANAAFFERQGGGIALDQTFMAALKSEVLEVIFNDALIRKFRGNLQRMDRANSLALMLDDLEALVAPPRDPGRTRAPAPSVA